MDPWEIVALKASNKLIGHVYLASDRELRPEERSILTTALNQFKTSVEKALYVEEVVALSVTDGMTDIGNRRHFTQNLEREIPRAIRHRQPLSLLIVDVDHFKKVNDIHGHLVGDVVLKGVARILEGCIRQTDLVARYGGEEFVVLAPSTDLESVRVLAERIRERVASTLFQSDGTRLSITVSLGVAELSLDQAQNADDLIAIADRRLYIAKREGRNRAVAHG
jgi:diguanylate cyclase (GGDEF)-like protein